MHDRLILIILGKGGGSETGNKNRRTQERVERNDNNKGNQDLKGKSTPSLFRNKTLPFGGGKDKHNNKDKHHNNDHTADTPRPTTQQTKGGGTNTNSKPRPDGYIY
jgi:hypothetical protein